MRKKYNSLEEVRAANAERARKWRAENRWEARVKKARAHGTKTVKVEIKGYGVIDVPEWILVAALPRNNARVLEAIAKYDRGRAGSGVARDTDPGADDQGGDGEDGRSAWGDRDAEAAIALRGREAGVQRDGDDEEGRVALAGGKGVEVEM